MRKGETMHREPFYGRGFAAFLFDMDGTILDSIAVANRIWSGWAQRHGLDVAAILAALHGVRAIETVTRFAPAGVDPQIEAEAITRAEIDAVDGIVEIPGAARFLRQLPNDRWAVVTSAPRALALRRIAAAGLPLPPLLVSAEDVGAGKPAPDGFLAAAEALGVIPADCLAWEDSPAGIAAAETAGMKVVVVDAHANTPGPGHLGIGDYRDLELSPGPDGLRVFRR